MSESKQPIYKIRHGRVSLALWENEGKDGKFESFTVERSYKDGEEVKNTGSFGTGIDLSNLDRCLFDLKVKLGQRG